MSKFIQSKETIKNLFFKYRKNKKKIALTHGVFDVIHLGHLDYFKEAKQLAEKDNVTRKPRRSGRKVVAIRRRTEITLPEICDYRKQKYFITFFFKNLFWCFSHSQMKLGHFFHKLLVPKLDMELKK